MFIPRWDVPTEPACGFDGPAPYLAMADRILTTIYGPRNRPTDPKPALWGDPLDLVCMTDLSGDLTA